MWQEATFEELKALFGIDILMGLKPLPQYTLYMHQNDFIGNSGVKKTMTCRMYQKLTQYLHVCGSCLSHSVVKLDSHVAQIFCQIFFPL